MPKFYLPFVIAFCLLTGCGKSKSPARPEATETPALASNANTATSSSDEDPVHKRLIELSGAGSVNCGDFKSSAPDELRAGSKCAEDSFRSNGPFFIEYEMPGLTVGVAGNTQSKFYCWQARCNGAGLTGGECPAKLRVASSGRVTC